jgi:hypothetical protein
VALAKVDHDPLASSYGWLTSPFTGLWHVECFRHRRIKILSGFHRELRQSRGCAATKCRALDIFSEFDKA